MLDTYHIPVGWQKKIELSDFAKWRKHLTWTKRISFIFIEIPHTKWFTIKSSKHFTGGPKLVYQSNTVHQIFVKTFA